MSKNSNKEMPLTGYKGLLSKEIVVVVVVVLSQCVRRTEEGKGEEFGTRRMEMEKVYVDVCLRLVV